MADEQAVKKENSDFGISNTASDLIILFATVILVFIASSFLNVFTFLVEFFQKNPAALNSVDEIVMVLLISSIGFAVISWRRLRELKKETAERVRLQAKIIEDYETKLEMEKVICKGLHYDLEEYRKLEQDILTKRQKTKSQDQK
jgi:uncharacterized membrane protein YcjF (UPF0283 family)